MYPPGAWTMFPGTCALCIPLCLHPIVPESVTATPQEGCSRQPQSQLRHPSHIHHPHMVQQRTSDNGTRQSRADSFGGAPSRRNCRQPSNAEVSTETQPHVFRRHLRTPSPHQAPRSPSLTRSCQRRRGGSSIPTRTMRCPMTVWPPQDSSLCKQVPGMPPPTTPGCVCVCMPVDMTRRGVERPGFNRGQVRTLLTKSWWPSTPCPSGTRSGRTRCTQSR